MWVTRNRLRWKKNENHAFFRRCISHEPNQTQEWGRPKSRLSIQMQCLISRAYFSRLFSWIALLAAGSRIHMIADDRGSRIADRGSQIAESSWIVCDHMEHTSAIFCDRLRSSDHMETKALRFAIETHPIIFLIMTHDSTLLSHKARMFVYSNAHLL